MHTSHYGIAHLGTQIKYTTLSASFTQMTDEVCLSVFQAHPIPLATAPYVEDLFAGIRSCPLKTVGWGSIGSNGNRQAVLYHQTAP